MCIDANTWKGASRAKLQGQAKVLLPHWNIAATAARLHQGRYRKAIPVTQHPTRRPDTPATFVVRAVHVPQVRLLRPAGNRLATLEHHTQCQGNNNGQMRPMKRPRPMSVSRTIGERILTRHHITP